jgi:iron complex outermembrane receptor protein
MDRVLSQVPGVIARSRYGGTDIQLMIRGFGARGAGDRSNTGSSRGVRVLIDGFPETEPDGRTALDQVDLGAASSIEVVRSNASAVWGNAAGGVVNVSTVPNVTRGTASVQTLQGSFGLESYMASAAAPVGSGTGYGTFSNTNSDGWRSHSSSKRSLLNAGLVGTVGERTDFGVYLVATKNLIHQPGPLTASQLATDPRQANATYLARDERRDNVTGRLGVTVDHHVSANTTISSSLFINPKYQQRSERNTYRDFTRYHLGGSLMARHSFTAGSVPSTLTVGVDDALQDGAILFYNLTPEGTRGTTVQQDKGEGMNNMGVFVEDAMTIVNRLTLLVGARYDRVDYRFRNFLPSPKPTDERLISRVSPKLGASWLLDASHSVYINIGRGIEVPAANESDPTPGTGAALLNPLQDPIISTTYELGFKGGGSQVGQTGIVASYDAALYNVEVRNDAIPYASGRYYVTAGRSRRTGIEIGTHAISSSGVFAGANLTLSRNRYLEYVVDSAVILPNDPSKVGAIVDYSGNHTIGIPGAVLNLELGSTIPGLRNVKLSGRFEASGKYFADDANVVNVPGYTIFDLRAALSEPVTLGGGLGVTGSVAVRNLTDKRYVAASFLNPDRVGTEWAAFQSGLPRSVLVMLSFGHR